MPQRYPKVLTQGNLFKHALRRDEGMGVYKRGDIYWISYSYQGEQYRESTGTDNK
jgi:integrase